MLTLFLAAAAQVTPLSLVDDANLALTSCGFEAVRLAREAGDSDSQFKARLDSHCRSIQANTRRVYAAFFISQRGMSRPAADALANNMVSDSRQRMIDQYARRHETDRQLEALERALQMEEK